MTYQNTDHKFTKCAHFTWSTSEEKMNEHFIKLKQKEAKTLDRRFFDSNFISNEGDTVKHLETMKSKKSYSVLHPMPKGALHHLHVDTCQDIEFVLSSVKQIKTYVLEYPGVYISPSFDEWKYGTAEEAAAAGWLAPRQMREKYTTEEEFEAALLAISQFTQDQAKQHSHTSGVWSHFQQKICRFLQIFNQEDIFREYLLYSLSYLIRNGYSRVELRIELFPIKRRNPTEMLDQHGVLAIYEEVERELQKIHPHFTIGLIVYGLKNAPLDELERYFRMVYSFESPLIVGVDMVQEEDIYPEFDFYESVFSKIRKEFEGKRTLPGVYHAGQTVKFQNHNIEKVAQFGSVRIGHGINLHQIIKQKSICVEVCPLSNQFLCYVKDLTQHPAIGYYHQGLPISISPDDPARFGYNGSTPDFFVAAHAFGFDLKDFKLLGIYSILHAVCSEQLKRKLLVVFEEDWTIFMEWFEQAYCC